MNMDTLDKYAPNSDAYKIEPEDGLLDDVFGLRRKTLTRKMTLLKEQINDRGRNLEDNLKGIEQDLCCCSTLSFQIPESNAEAQSHIVFKYKMPLYKESRQQKTDCLRDTAMLRRELLDTILQYQSLEDKEEFLR